MEKMKMHSKSKIDENVKKIAALFPECITEIINEKEELEKVVDIDAFRQLFSKTAVEGNQERYQFTWPDKRKARALVNQEVTSTLRPCREESVNFDTTENLYIEGDNLEVLKLLQETYLGKIKMIYIDPPYNTGNDFVYEDDYSQAIDEYKSNSAQYDNQGNRLVANTESNGRFHTDWLNMMYPRLRLAKDLLTDDGVIFISIDDNELSNLKKICDEIYGEENCQGVITYVRKTSGKQDSSNFMNSTEYIVVYSKSSIWDCAPLIAGENVTSRYNKVDESGKAYRETDLRKTGTGDRREDRPLMWYPFYYNPLTNRLFVERNHNQKLLDEGYVEIYPIKPDGTDGRWRWGYETAVSNIEYLVARIMPKYASQNKYTIYEIDYIDKKGEIRTVKEHTCWDRKEFNSDNAMQEFKSLGFSNQLFPFPKSSELMKHIIYLSNDKSGIYMDFFSGSGTFAQGILKQNLEDNGNRKFILVQIPEECKGDSEAFKAGYKNICEIGKERIRRAGNRLLEEMKNKNADLFSASVDLDIGFRDLKLDTSNMNKVYYIPDVIDQRMLDGLESNIKEGRTSEDLLFQVMLDLGVLLSAKISEEEIAGKKVFNVDNNYLITCFDEDINEDVIIEVAKKKPIYFVMRDSSLANDSVFVNFDQIFARYSPDTIRKVL